jgi:hypothetical protein
VKVINLVGNYGVFPMRVTCKRVVDQYGFAYGEEKDFCGSELEVVEDDIKQHPWFKYPYYEGTDYGVICPVCGKFIVIDEHSLPVGVINKAEKIRLH